MFACAMYPEDDPEFVAEVEAEARYQVRRLRSHPCLALWCGNNENQWLHDMRYWNDPEPPPYGALYYDQILPRAVAELDGRTPYWPGSPYGGNDHNSMDEGNRPQLGRLARQQSPRRFGEEPRRESHAGGRLLPALRRGHGPLHQRVRDARRAGAGDAATGRFPPTSSTTTARRWTGTTRTTRRTRATC